RDRVDILSGYIDAYPLAVGDKATPPCIVGDSPDFCQTPTQFASRVIGYVPQKLAQVRSQLGTRLQRQVSEQRSHLARRRHGDIQAFTRCGERAEQPQMETIAQSLAGLAVGAASLFRLSRFPVGFHAHSNARFNARSNAGALVTPERQAAATRAGGGALLL